MPPQLPPDGPCADRLKGESHWTKSAARALQALTLLLPTQLRGGWATAEKVDNFKALITHVLWSLRKGPKERGLLYKSRPVQGSHPAKRKEAQTAP